MNIGAETVRQTWDFVKRLTWVSQVSRAVGTLPVVCVTVLKLNEGYFCGCHAARRLERVPLALLLPGDGRKPVRERNEPLSHDRQ